jgi:hypothetical protein
LAALFSFVAPAASTFPSPLSATEMPYLDFTNFESFSFKKDAAPKDAVPQ